MSEGAKRWASVRPSGSEGTRKLAAFASHPELNDLYLAALDRAERAERERDALREYTETLREALAAIEVLDTTTYYDDPSAGFAALAREGLALPIPGEKP